VADSGVGIPAGVLAELNERLDNAPVMDVSVSRHMGLFAVARLAERHGIRVRLRARPPQGIIAMVWLPDTIITDGDRPFARLHPALRHIGVPGRRPAGGSRTSLPAQPALPTRPPSPPRPPARPAARSAAVASAKWFTDPHAGNGDALGAGGPAQPYRTSEPAGYPGGGLHSPAGNGHGEQAGSGLPARGGGEQTSTGLPVRVPRANLAQGLADTGRRADATAPGYQPDHHEPHNTGPQWAHRSPDIARSRLSGFQRGSRRGKSQIPSAGEGIDR
jgi:hypothetical protein